ncbi:MAG TPA: hypothetical protein VD737_05120 [Steroidobacteraceae bacterium]|nr:hypothetical protein [Steroidobacteraceae bacterium]
MQHAAELQFDAGVRRAESVCLTADEFVIDRSLRGARRGPTLTVAHRHRRCESELALLDGHRLAVRDRRREVVRRYVVDLRFIADAPVTIRTVAWNCWLASFASLATAGLAAWLAWAQRAHPQAWSAWVVALGLAATALLLGAVALYRTYETTLLFSVDGHVTLARLTGALGSTRHAAAFHAELTRGIAAARAAIAQSRQAFLRDELREHRRLYEEGVLPADAYEAGKRRILQAHD